MVKVGPSKEVPVEQQEGTRHATIWGIKSRRRKRWCKGHEAAKSLMRLRNRRNSYSRASEGGGDCRTRRPESQIPRDQQAVLRGQDSTPSAKFGLRN